MPTSPSASFLSSSGLKGLMMRRSSSYSSSVHLSPTVAPPQSPSLDDSASSIGHTSEEAPSPSTTGVHAASQQDSGDEVRFSVEVTRLKNLPGLYSVDFKRIKGSVWSYKSIYQKAVECVAASFCSSLLASS
jgi:protein-serine/threonine kinase